MFRTQDYFEVTKDIICPGCGYRLAAGWGMEKEVETEEHYETVNHPPHYNKHPSGIECITIVQEFSFNIGTAMKHLWRAGMKPSADVQEDLDKAITYINFEKERLSK